MQILHLNAQTNQYYKCCQCVKHKGLLTTPTLKNDNAFVGMAVLFDRLDWTTETEYKEGFKSEQTFYTKLSYTSKIF